MENIFKKLINLLFENSCPVCRSGCADLMICNSCEGNLEVRKDLYIKELDGIKIYSWGLYDGNLRQAIISLKNGKKELSSLFANKLIDFWKSINKNNSNDFLVIQIPSHKKRVKERGYCQTTLISEHFAKKLNYSFSSSHIARKKETNFMNKLNLEERIENIKDAFEVVKPFQNNFKVIVIDDIFTSGSTMQEIERTIHKEYPNVELIGLTVAAGDTW
jgi:competence protein ComFC